MIDICTVVFEAEISTLKLQARSIELYCQNIGVDRIFVMVNDASVIDPAWWGSLSDRVDIYHRSALGTNWHENGWVSQQVLKMLGAATSDNAWCMILDAKTLFVRKVDLDEIMVHGRPATGQLDIYPVFAASKQITDQLFDIDLPAQIGPGGVPFLVEPQLVRDMMVNIYRRTGQTFADYFQSQGRLTEFILYSGYVWSCDQTFERYHAQSKISPCNLCHSEVALFDQKLQQMRHPATLTVSVHRHAWSQLLPDQQQQYWNLLSQRGIV